MASFPVTNLKIEPTELFNSLLLQQQQTQQQLLLLLHLDPSSSSASPLKDSPNSSSEINGNNLQPIPKKSAIIKTDRPRPHICTTCTRAFARLEHLKRHERSHTNEKPFQCGACGRCFARRDLVLRHQQKLHASLPTTNRARIRKHNFDHDVQAGDIVQDYLNENINIVYKNTNPKLPLPNDSNQNINNPLEESPDEEQRVKRLRKSISSKKTPTSKDHSPPSLRLDSMSNSYTTTSPSLEISPQVVGSLFTGIPHTFQPKPQQQVSPITSNTSPPDKPSHFKDDEHNQQQQLYENSTPMSFSSNAMYPSLSDHVSSTTMQNDNEEHSKTRGRHSSFSAACLSSYTLLKDAQDIKEHELPEAPHQVGFATPQLTAQELSERAVLAGFDLDALGIDAHDYTNDNGALDGKRSDNGGYFTNSHGGTSKGSTPFEFKITPVGSLLDMPLLQQYLQVGGAGGGAGFEGGNNFKFNSNTATGSNNNNNNNNMIHGGNNSSKNIKNTDWLAEFIGTPFDINFPPASHNIGFTDTSINNITNNNSNNNNIDSLFKGATSANNNTTTNKISSPSSDDIPLLFRSRQIDLFKQISMKNNFQQNSQLLACKSGEFFTTELRNQILQRYDLQNNQFPLLEDLNKYMSLYELEFDKYFPFIHLPSLYLNHGDDHLPLLLAIAAIGALYSFHGTNSSILAKLSRYLIHNFMGAQKSFENFNDIPLPITQGLILDIYLGMFGNEIDITKITSKHLHSVICLVKSTQLNIGLENFILPPPIIDSNTNDDPQQLKNNYEYFILAQSRIRTVHVLYYLCVLFASLLGNDIELTAEDLKSGIPCQLEELWKANTAQDWAAVLKLNRISIDSKFSLIQISNGESMKEIINDLQNHYSDKSLNFKTLLSALMYISETIYKMRMELEKEPDVALKATKWRMNSRPEIESLIKSWEFIYVKNGGVLVPREANIHVINQTPVLKLILPLLSFAKIRKCVYFTPILNNIWTKNWDAMNQELRYLAADPEALRDGTNYSLEIVNLWIDLISISKDAEKTSIRTPIFFLTCIFAAILMIGEYLYATEAWAQNYLASHSANNSTTSSPATPFGSVHHNLPPTLNAIDRVLWLKTQNLMKKVETNLNPSATNSESFNNVNEEISKLVLEPSIDLKHTAEIITMAKLSLKSLNVGVRILADAPVWPVALVFAEALKARSKFINDDQMSSN